MKIIDMNVLINDKLTTIEEMKTICQWGEKNHKIFSRFHGFKSSCLFPKQTLFELISNCLDTLLNKHPDKVKNLTHIIYAHSLNSIYPFDLQLLEEKLSKQLPKHVELYSITQGSCASGFLGIELLESQLNNTKSNPKYAILISGEKCFHQPVQYTNQTGYSGEGCVAVLLSNTNEKFASSEHIVDIKSISWTMLGGYSKRVLKVNRDSNNEYDKNFISIMVKTAQSVLEKAGLEAEKIAGILPYHISPATFDRLADSLGISRELIFKKNMYYLGHCFCGDTFINLYDYLRQIKQQDQQNFLLAVVAGIAGTFSAMMLELRSAYIR